MEPRTRGYKGGAEFAPGELEESLHAFDRRTFMKLMGAALALAGTGEMAGCSKPQPDERIVPYVRNPEGLVPGIPLFYASAIPASGWVSGFGRGVVVEQHEGRPTKIEGNPDHPSSLGAADIFMQTSVLQLYDPDRSKEFLHPPAGQPVTWGAALEELRSVIAGKGGASRVRIGLLTGVLTSPTLLGQIQSLRGIFTHFSWHMHDIADAGSAREGQRNVLGKSVTPVYDFSKASRIFSLDANFLADESGGLAYARALAHRRRLPFQALGPTQTHVTDPASAPSAPSDVASGMSRFYMVESTISYTGAIADHRLAIKGSVLPAVARALLQLTAGVAVEAGPLTESMMRWTAGAAVDLKAAGPESLVIAGPYAPPEVHAAAMAMNHLLSSTGQTVRYLEPVEGVPETDGSLSHLVQTLNAGEMDLLLIMDTNPAFTAPGDIAFSDVLRRFTARGGRTVHLGGYVDETAELCDLHIPLSHPLESWGDVRGHDGTASIIQPLIRPLWQSRAAVEVLGALAGIGAETRSEAAGPLGITPADIHTDGYEWVRRTWLARWQNLDPAAREARWRKSLRDGIIEGTAAVDASGQAPDVQRIIQGLAALSLRRTAPLEIVFRPDPVVADGAWANQGWLQELPRPLTHIMWDNAAIMGAQTASRLGIEQPGDSRDPVTGVRISIGGRTVEIPAWVQPGHPEETITLHVGNGRRSGGRVQRAEAGGGGTDIYPLQRSGALWLAADEGIKVEVSTRRFTIACAQSAQWADGRDMTHTRAVTDLSDAAGSAPDLTSTEVRAGKSVHLSLYKEKEYAGYKWGMVVDLSACTGCNACVVACQAENNIPIVGKGQALLGREMHWMRIDTYYGPADTHSLAEAAASPDVKFQPMLCQHCEDAPCELVCPVEATTHSAEGVNEMTYNRCIGTRYCSNNCPYKVRRFNFLGYNPGDEPTLNMQKNPNVTVRSRGVMEKCNYCIQRINRARIDAKREWARHDTTPRPHQAPVEMRTLEPDGGAESLPRLRVQTACQQACPTEAIVFGDMNDSGSLVHQLKTRQPWGRLQFGVLLELNTQPRTSYLERLINLNPALLTPLVGGRA